MCRLTFRTPLYWYKYSSLPTLKHIRSSVVAPPPSTSSPTLTNDSRTGVFAGPLNGIRLGLVQSDSVISLYRPSRGMMNCVLMPSSTVVAARLAVSGDAMNSWPNPLRRHSSAFIVLHAVIYAKPYAGFILETGWIRHSWSACIHIYFIIGGIGDISLYTHWYMRCPIRAENWYSCFKLSSKSICRRRRHRKSSTST